MFAVNDQQIFIRGFVRGDKGRAVTIYRRGRTWSIMSFHHSRGDRWSHTAVVEGEGNREGAEVGEGDGPEEFNGDAIIRHGSSTLHVQISLICA